MSARSRPPADPDQVIAAFLAADQPVEPEPVFLAWLLSLEVQLDPAEAAAALLADLSRGGAPLRAPKAARLLIMLEDTTQWPRPALAALPVARRQAVRV